MLRRLTFNTLFQLPRAFNSSPSFSPAASVRDLQILSFARAPFHSRPSGGNTSKEVEESIMPEQISKKLGFIGAGNHHLPPHSRK